METKKEYTFEDIDKFEEEIGRIIYMWRRYEGTKTQEGKVFTNMALENLKDRINEYLDCMDKFDYDQGKVSEFEEGL